MTDEQPAMAKLRWFYPTPGRLLVFLLAVEGILLLSERWFPKGWAVLIAVAAVAGTIVLMLLWLICALVFRWRFQFSIRSLLLSTIAVAVPCSWMTVEVQQARRQKESVDALAKVGAWIYYDYQHNSTSGKSVRGGKPPRPSWLPQKVIGDDFFINVYLVNLDRSKVTDVDLRHLEGLDQLPNLEIAVTEITDAGLRHIKGLRHLHALLLDKTQITDAGLEYLSGMNQLQTLRLSQTKVTDAGVAKLQKALPNCKISH